MDVHVVSMSEAEKLEDDIRPPTKLSADKAIIFESSVVCRALDNKDTARLIKELKRSGVKLFVFENIFFSKSELRDRRLDLPDGCILDKDTQGIGLIEWDLKHKDIDPKLFDGVGAVLTDGLNYQESIKPKYRDSGHKEDT